MRSKNQKKREKSKADKSKNNESNDEKTTEFKQFVLNEMIKIVIHMNTVKFCNVYWNTIDKYYHVMVWTIIKLQE